MVKVAGVKSLVLGALLFAAVLPTQKVAAEQIVVFDEVYEATAENTTNSEYRAQPAAGIPANWREPINYANGTAHVRFEVISKPSAAPTLLNICFRNPSSYACMAYPPAYTATGVNNFQGSFPNFWQYAMVDWTMGVTELMFVLKDTDEKFVHANPDYYPYKMRITITVVSPGGTYVPPPLTPVAGAGGRGGAGGTGGMSGAGAGGRSGSGGMSAAAGRGGSGGTPAGRAGAGGMEPEDVEPGPADAGPDPDPDPDPDPMAGEPDASVVDASVPGFDDEEEPERPGRLPPQGLVPEPDKRAPPPGGLEGNCAIGTAGRADAAAWWVVLAGVWLIRRRRGRRS